MERTLRSVEQLPEHDASQVLQLTTVADVAVDEDFAPAKIAGPFDSI
jgi:hypothetical protein